VKHATTSPVYRASIHAHHPSCKNQLIRIGRRFSIGVNIDLRNSTQTLLNAICPARAVHFGSMSQGPPLDPHFTDSHATRMSSSSTRLGIPEKHVKFQNTSLLCLRRPPISSGHAATMSGPLKSRDDATRITVCFGFTPDSDRLGETFLKATSRRP